MKFSLFLSNKEYRNLKYAVFFLNIAAFFFFYAVPTIGNKFVNISDYFAKKSKI